MYNLITIWMVLSTMFLCLAHGSKFLDVSDASATRYEPPKEASLEPSKRITDILKGDSYAKEVRQSDHFKNNILIGGSHRDHEYCFLKDVKTVARYFDASKNKDFFDFWYASSSPADVSIANNYSDNQSTEKKRDDSLAIELLEQMGEFQVEIAEASKKTQISEVLIGAVIKKESMFDPQAKNGDAKGLMQLRPLAQKEMGVKNPYNPKENITGGAKYLAEMRKTFGSDELALAAYKIGESRLKSEIKKRGRKVPPEAQKYVASIMTLYKKTQLIA